jgi:hypothetical protein
VVRSESFTAKGERAGFTAEAQSSQRFVLSIFILRVLGVSVVKSVPHGS